MFLPLSIIFPLYFLFILFIIIFFLVHLYHLYQFSFWNTFGYVATGIYIIMFLSTLGISFMYISQIDWTAPLNFF